MAYFHQLFEYFEFMFLNVLFLYYLNTIILLLIELPENEYQNYIAML